MTCGSPRLNHRGQFPLIRIDTDFMAALNPLPICEPNRNRRAAVMAASKVVSAEG
jgi:hypothetical protein